jgi:hypothetical protein
MRETTKVSMFALAACAVGLGCSQTPTSPSSPPSAVSTAAGSTEVRGWRDFAAQGWNCRSVPNTPVTVCSPPGQPLPVVAIPPAVPPPDRPPTVTLKRWINGVFDANVHLIRPEIYQGQTCGSTGAPYAFAAVLGYYECAHG